jgi:predicted kinase
MTERLKRRKKTGTDSPKEASKAPEPLQPRFYDDQPAVAEARSETAVESPVVDHHKDTNKDLEPKAASRRAESRVASSTPEPAPTAEAASEAESVAEPTSTPGVSRPRPTRRRRGRGGRGGSRQRTPAGAPAVIADPSEAASEAAPVASPAHAQAGAAVPAPARATKGTVVLAIGLPGSGKSSWFKRHSIHPLSSDLLRELLFDDAQEQRFQDLVFSNLRSMLKARLIARRPMNYVDATNLTPHDRHSWIKLAKDYGYDVQGLFFDVPLEVCMERHQRRGRAVPEDIMRKMASKLKAPTFDEGFSKITVVRVKQKEEGAAE